MTLHLGGQCGLEHLRGRGGAGWGATRAWAWCVCAGVSPQHPRTHPRPSLVCWPPRSDHTNGRIPYMRSAMIAALNSPATGTVTNQATKMLRKRRQSTAFRERIQPTATTEPTWRKEHRHFRADPGETQSAFSQQCRRPVLSPKSDKKLLKTLDFSYILGLLCPENSSEALFHMYSALFEWKLSQANVFSSPRHFSNQLWWPLF